ncbi:MAG: TonB family protein [Opitutaceae bacterium]
MVPALVTVGENGRVLKIEDAPPPLIAPLRAAARRWRFEPALENGTAVPQTILLPFIVVATPFDPAQGKKRTIPRPLHQTPPAYPPLMVASGLQGEVLVGFEVDIEGRVSKCHSVRTLNPSFDDAAMAAVRTWRFEPGRIDGVPAVTKMQVPVIFTIEGGSESIEDPLGIKTPAKPDSLPEGYRYDTPPRPVDTVLPVYPYPAIRDHLSGETEVLFVVGPAGRLVHAEVVSASRPEFGLALKASLEQFEFKPATLAGKPARAAFRIRQRFERADANQLLTEQDLRILKMETDEPARIRSLGELDYPLKPVNRRPVEFPLGTKAESGSAEVEFLVDEEGRVRLPRVKSASDDAFGYAAVQSISKWVFEPPLDAGRPAVVRASVPIAFKLE